MKSVRPKLGSSVANEITAAEFRRTRPDLKQSKGGRRSDPGGSQGRSWVRRSAAEDRTADGITFASKAEATRYGELKLEKAAGTIEGFVCQPKLPLAGVWFTPDFLVWRLAALGFVAVWLEDVKGKNSHPEVLRRFRRNAKQVKELYGLEVRIVTV